MLIAAPHQRGFSIIEVMIALIVISIGFLAAARMQIEGLRGSQDAYFQSQANFMVREMADRMRLNSQGALDGHYNNLVTSAKAASKLPACISAETVCTSRHLAIADLAFWSRYLHPSPKSVDFTPLLPSGDTVSAAGSVTLVSAGVYTVAVTWSESVDGTEETRMMSVQVSP